MDIPMTHFVLGALITYSAPSPTRCASTYIKCVPLDVLLPVVGVPEERGSDDAEREQEAHGEAEEGERRDAVGQHHGVRVQGTAFLLAHTALVKSRSSEKRKANH